MTRRELSRLVLGKAALVGGFAIAAVAVAAGAAPQRPGKNFARLQNPPADTDMALCIAPDRTLHASLGGTCPGAQARVEVEAPSGQVLDCTQCSSQEPDRSNVASGKARNAELAHLERRIDALHTSPLFTVIDRQKHPMVAVRPGALLLYDQAGLPVASMLAQAVGGSITASSTRGLAAALGSSNTEAGLRISDQSVLRLRLNGQAGGTYALAVPSLGASGAIAGIGESKAGTGTMIVASLAGATKALLEVSDGKGVGGIFNSTGLSVLSLTQGASDGGLLAMGNAQSEPTAKMGVKADRYGVVLTGPGAGFPLVTGSALPGSYILGCAPGPACEP